MASLKEFLLNDEPEAREAVRKGAIGALRWNDRRSGGTDHLVEDAVQETWLFLLEQPQRNLRNPAGWVYRVAYRKARRFAKTHLRLVGKVSVEELAIPAPAPASSVAELEYQLQRLDDRLSKVQRRVLTLALAGLTVRQIAVATDRSPSGIYHIIASIRDAILTLLDPPDPPPGGAAARMRGVAPDAVSHSPSQRRVDARRASLARLLTLPAFREPCDAPMPAPSHVEGILALPAFRELDARSGARGDEPANVFSLWLQESRAPKIDRTRKLASGTGSVKSTRVRARSTRRSSPVGRSLAVLAYAAGLVLLLTAPASPVKVAAESRGSMAGVPSSPTLSSDGGGHSATREGLGDATEARLSSVANAPICERGGNDEAHLGASPHEPAATSGEENSWKFEYKGYIRAPARVSFGTAHGP